MAMKYFISYTHKDESWATWIAEVIEQHGGNALIQAWDIRPGDNFVLKMDEFVREADVFVPVFSQDYFHSYYGNKEWAAAFATAKSGTKKMIPVRVTDVEPDGILIAEVYIDLYGISDVKIATDRLLEGLGITEIERKAKKGFPGTTHPQATAAHTTRARFPGALPPNNLTGRNEYFTGRSEVLKNIHTKFSQSKFTQTKFSQDNTISLEQTITGLGGIGKTQTALEYAFRFGNEYNDAIWWVIADTEMSAMSGFLSFAEYFGLIPEGMDEAQKLSPEQLGKRLNGWFEAHDSWLFIFDNVEKAKVIDPYITGMKTGHVLITTRDKELKKGRSIDIDLFTPEEAADFMRARLAECLHLIENETVLAALTSRLDYFPLALEQAAAYMERAQISYQQYLSLLEESGLKALTTKLGKPTNYHSIVTVTLKLSLDKLSLSARQLIYICSYMSSDKIPLEFFARQHEDFPEPFCVDFDDRITADEIITELLNYSLVKRDGSFLNMHRLVQEIVRELEKDGDTDWLGICLDTMVAAMPDLGDYGHKEPRDWFELLAAHAAAVAVYAGKAYSGNDEKGVQTALLCNGLGVGYNAVAQYDKALEWHFKDLAITENVLGCYHLDTATSYNNIAFVYDSQGDYSKALEWHFKDLAIREKVLGVDHPDTATSYNNIAVMYKSQGDYSKALEWHLKALAIREKVLGVDHPDTATSYNNIAMIYKSQGDYSKALEWYLKALAIREKVLGVDHPDTAATYNNIALVYHSQGDYSKALEWHLKALAINEKVLGFDHPDTATSYDNIALVYHSQGDYSKALEWHLKALAIREKVLGFDHPDTAASYNNIAMIYKSQGDYFKALEWFLKALVINEKILGFDHPNTATMYNNIATVYNRHDYSKALEWHLKALAIHEKALGIDHPDTANSYNNIALVYDNKGDHSKALEWYLKSYSIFLHKLGEAHSNTITCKNNMELAYNNTSYTEPFDQWLKRNSAT